MIKILIRVLRISDTNYVSQEDFERVITHIPDLKIRKWVDADIGWLFRILRFSALRPGEAIKLRKEDFLFASREIFLGKTKTKERGERAVIPTDFVQNLEMYIMTKKSGRIFPGLTYPTFYTWLKRLGQICEIKAWTTPQSVSGEKTVGHIFRKSMPKDMLDQKYGEKASQLPFIQAFLRHQSIATTDKYIKQTQEAVKRAL